MSVASITRITLILILSTLSDASSFVCDKNVVPCGCGQTAVGINARIVNGENAVANSWPMIVSLTFRDMVAMHICGGTILNEFYILTAAHCVDSLLTGISPSDISIAAGIHMLSQSNPIIRQINRTIIHPLWNASFHYIQYDIALIRLAEPLNLDGNASITRTCLPPRFNTSEGTVNYPPIDTDLVIIGWGRLNTTGPVPDTLQQVTVKLIDPLDRTCASIVYDPLTQLCAGLYEGGKGPCFGDSGGPIFRWIGDRWEQVGIVSYGERGCAVKGYPAVFTRISYFVDWIQSLIDDTNQTPTQYNLTAQYRQLYSCDTYFSGCGCGRRSVALSPTLAAPTENALPYSWSMIVSIRIANQHVCSGTILEDFHILTSARCLTNQQPQYITVRAGIHRLWEGGATIRQVDRIYIHPNYSASANSHVNDIAVLHLTQSMNIDDDAYVSKTCLPSSYDQWTNVVQYRLDGTWLVIAGWNLTQMENVFGTDVLQQAKAMVMEGVNSSCSVSNAQLERQLCAGRDNRDRDDCCANDAGSPIFFWNYYQWIQVGLASYCATPDDLGVFTRVEPYSEWIWSTVDSSDHERSTVYHCDRKASCGCGQTDAAFTVASAGDAESAVAHSWPMMVSFQLSNWHICSGTILSDSFILTAVECVQGMKKYNQTAVVAGVHRLSGTEQVIRQVDRIYIHPNYSDNESSMHDIAIVRLDRPLPLNDRSSMLAKTCLPIVRDPPANEYSEGSLPVVIIGWHRFKPYSGTSDTLQQIPAELIQSDYQGCSNSLVDNTYQFCAESIQNRTKSNLYYLCYGDVGGPVLIYKNNHWEQIGMAPYTESCQSAGYVHLYTRLAPYIEWMQNVTNSSLTTYSPSDGTSAASDHRRHQLLVAVLSLLLSTIF